MFLHFSCAVNARDKGRFGCKIRAVEIKRVKAIYNLSYTEVVKIVQGQREREANY